ncbi:MAG: DUF998 domain-containing protein [Burkholderiales bacterium]|uniref:DUF998 domain-containing protein n=1 Tax=Dokdonella sp. TaxID=2291710 RepID=UPI0027B8BA05|nr:DUF998 domain-containing protein [Dokdonella sp.]MCZ2135870.1 DUF998 domain-containing protein [Burkholderiales bacterium]
MPIARFVAIAAVILAGVLVGVAHRRRRDLPFRETALSAYFTKPTRSTMNAAYAAIAAALVATALVELQAGGGVGTIAAIACAAAAVLLAPVAATTQRDAATVRSDATRRTHRRAAVAAFAAAGVAMAASAAGAFARADVPVVSLGVVGTVLVVVVLRSQPGPTYGLRQKLLLGALGGWVVAVAAVG